MYIYNIYIYIYITVYTCYICAMMWQHIVSILYIMCIQYILITYSTWDVYISLKINQGREPSHECHGQGTRDVDGRDGTIGSKRPWFRGFIWRNMRINQPFFHDIMGYSEICSTQQYDFVDKGWPWCEMLCEMIWSKGWLVDVLVAWDIFGSAAGRWMSFLSGRKQPI